MKINIKFLFFDKKLCGRCKTTEESLIKAVEEFRKRHKDTQIEIDRQKLSEREIEKSPTILLDGKDVESYLAPKFEQKSVYCDDCSCLVGRPVSCRTYNDHQSLSVDQILIAIERHLASRQRC